VIVNYSRSRGPAEQVVEDIERDGGQAKALQANISDPEQTKRLFDQAIEMFGRSGILVNNVGIFALKPLVKCSDDDFGNTFTSMSRRVSRCARGS
jgi:NAD(P)-dependent dehydrogenase (short-subunit alcohol dehydrogenase family)